MIGSGRAGWVHLGKRERGRDSECVNVNAVCGGVCMCM